MEIIEFFSSENKELWIQNLLNCEWGAGKWLGELLRDGKLQEKFGEGAGHLYRNVRKGRTLQSLGHHAPEV